MSDEREIGKRVVLKKNKVCESLKQTKAEGWGKNAGKASWWLDDDNEIVTLREDKDL